MSLGSYYHGGSEIERTWLAGRDICEYRRQDLQAEAERLRLPRDGLKDIIAHRLAQHYRQLQDRRRQAENNNNASPAANDDENVEDLRVPIRSFLDRHYQNDFRCEVELDILPQVSINGVELKYPIDEEMAARVVFASKNGPSLLFGHDQVKISSPTWLDVFNNDSSKSVILECVQKVLAPGCHPVYASFDKLCILKPGSDHYSLLKYDNTNTWSRGGSFGSLLVFLPSRYKRGELVVKNDNTVQQYSFGVSDVFDSLKCKAVAFFHNQAVFQPVAAGCCVFLRYFLGNRTTSVNLSSFPAPPLINTNSVGEQKICRLFEKLFQMPGWSNQQAAGVILPGNYPAPCFPVLLRSADRVAYNGLANSEKFIVEIVSVKLYISGSVDAPAGQPAEFYYNTGLSQGRNVGITVKKIDDHVPLVLRVRASTDEERAAYYYSSPEDVYEQLAGFTLPGPDSHPNDRVRFVNNFLQLKIPRGGSILKLEPQPTYQFFKISFQTTALLVKPKPLAAPAS